MRALRAGTLGVLITLTAGLAGPLSGTVPSALGAPGGADVEGYAAGTGLVAETRTKGLRPTARPTPDGADPEGADPEGADPDEARPGGQSVAPSELRADTYIGQAWYDPEESSVENARDLRSADVYTDKAAGFIAAVGKFQAEPTKTNTDLVIYSGVVSGGACHARQIVFAPTRGGKGGWLTVDAAGQVTDSGNKGVTSTRVGKRAVLEATVKQFETGTYGCGFATVSNEGGATTYDGTGYVVFGEVAQKFEFYLGSRFLDPMSSPLHVGRVVGKQGKIKITVRNDIVDLDVSDVTGTQMRMAGPGHVKVKPSVAGLGTVESYDEKTGVFKVTLTKRKKAVLKWTAVGDFSVTNGTVTVHPATAPVSWGKSLAGRRFWAETSLDWERKGLWFVNKRFAYVGHPKAGMPTCKKASGRCKPYSYSKSKRKLVVGGKAAKLKGVGFTWKGHRYAPLATPKAGTRWQTSLTHTNATTSGTLEYLDLYFEPDGSFASRRQVFAREATTPVGDGRYQVLKNGRLRLTYDDGPVVNTNVGILVDKQGRPDPWETGLFVGDLEYTYR